MLWRVPSSSPPSCSPGRRRSQKCLRVKGLTEKEGGAPQRVRSGEVSMARKRAVKKKHSALKRAGVSGFNKPKRTPKHPKKSHVVVAKAGDKIKTIRFGQQGVSGSPKRTGETKKAAARRRSFKARHSKNIAKGTMSAAYWANKVKW